MFPHLTRFNLKNWIDENRGDWGRRRVIWEDSDFIIFVTRGPNDRTDFHINPGDEVFYQLEGELNLHYLTPEHKPEVAVLKEGEMFLLPALVPHSPRRATAPGPWWWNGCAGRTRPTASSGCAGTAPTRSTKPPCSSTTPRTR